MAVLMKCGGIFLHIPKTGGNWISEVLEEQNLVFCHFGERHANMSAVVDFEKWFRTPAKYGKPNRGFFKFCFVRHPLRWYESWFKMQRDLGWPNWGGQDGVWHPNAFLDGLGHKDFNGFIRNVLDRTPGFVTRMYGWYVQEGIHFVGKQERMADDLCAVLRHLNVPHDPQKIQAHRAINVSAPADIKWDPDLERQMEKAELGALRDFGYLSDSSGEVGGSTAGPTAWKSPVTAELHLRGPYTQEGDNAWRFPLPAYEEYADNLDHPYRSSFVLMEDDQVLSSAHALHDDIRCKGCGRYSHWRDFVLFSTSDNSDPNRNGRRYTMKFCYGFSGSDGSPMIPPRKSLCVAITP